jgi:hypothetical protein
VVRAPFRIAGRVARLGRARKPGRRLRRILLIAVVVLFLLFIVPTVMIVPQEGGLASVPPGLLVGVTPELSPQGAGVGVGTASVDGIPFAEVFNRVASLGLDPRLVAAVAWVETGGFAGDVIACERDSDAGARGVMQLLPGTARELGVDPCDPEQAIPGGARYLLEQHERFDDWQLAIAAYNAGPGAVEGCRCVPHNGETELYVTKVMDRWERFEELFPESEVSGVVGPASVTPRGGTDPYPAPTCKAGELPTPGGGGHPSQSGPCITATLRRAVNATIAAFGRGHGVGCSRPGDPEDHGKGRACDLMVSTTGRRPTPEMRAHGQAMADWLVANAEALGVQYVIWEQHIWNISRAREGWRPMADRGSVTQNHFDHVHLSVRS